MTKNFFDLQRFTEGGTSAGNGDGALQGAAENNVEGVSSGEGTQATGTAADTNSSGAGKNRREEYAKFKAEYKDIYDAEVSGIVKSRLKGQKDLQARLDSQDKVLSLLGAKYGVEDTDALYDAIKNDTDYWASAADREDMSPEKYAKQLDMQLQNKRMSKELNEIRARERAKAQYDAWVQESENVKAKYPEFDLATELSNPRFAKLISSRDGELRTSLQQAYEIIHMNEIMENNKKQTISDVVSDVKARGLRPSEAGTDSQDAANVSVDVSKLTREQRAEYARRASYGEVITFR